MAQETITLKDGLGVNQTFLATKDNEGNISLLQTNKSLELAVTMGQMDGYSKIDKYGELPDIDVLTTPSDIWEQGGIYTFDTNGTAPIAYISSSDNADVQDIEIIGLDINGNEVTQTVTLTGQAVVVLNTALWRVFRMSNEGAVNVSGIIYLGIDPTPTAGIPSPTSSIRAIINDGNNQTLMCIYTIPKGKVGFLFRGEIGTSRNKDGDARCSYYSRRFGKVFKVKKRVDVVNNGSSTYQDVRSFPDVIPALTDIKLTVETVSKDDMGMWGTFDILLVDEGKFPITYLTAIGQPT